MCDFEQLDHRIGQRLIGLPCAQQARHQTAAQTVGPTEHRHRRAKRRAAVQGLNASDQGSSTALSVIASSNPAAVNAAHLGENPISLGAVRRRHRHAHVLGNLVVTVDRGRLPRPDRSRESSRGARWAESPQGGAVGRQFAIAQGRQNLASGGRRHVDSQHAAQLVKS